MRCAPSTRRFTDEPVPREVLERVLDNARFAPSGGNRQGWRVDRRHRPRTRARRMRELYEQPWDAYTEQTGARARCSTTPERAAGRAARTPADAAGRRRVRPQRSTAFRCTS